MKITVVERLHVLSIRARHIPGLDINRFDLAVMPQRLDRVLPPDSGFAEAAEGNF